MNNFAVAIFRYQYREPKGKVPCDYLESTQNVFALFLEMGRMPLRIICREVGGSSDNHVHPDGGQGERDITKTFRGVSFVHGVIRHPSWQHSVGDKVWLRSDIPLFKGRKSIPIVNLTQARSAEAYIRDIEWLPDMRSKGPPGSPSLLLTITGPRYPINSPALGSHRMAIVVDRNKEIHDPLPEYPYPVAPPLAITTYIHSYGITTFEPPEMSPAEKQLERALARVDEVRARLDNDADHYTVKVVNLDEMFTAFEDVVDIVEVKVATMPPNAGRRVPAAAENESIGNEPRKRMLAELASAFSEEHSSLKLDLTAAKRKY